MPSLIQLLRDQTIFFPPHKGKSPTLTVSSVTVMHVSVESTVLVGAIRLNIMRQFAVTEQTFAYHYSQANNVSLRCV